MNDWKEKIAFKGDKILWYIVIMLMIASVMVVYSSTGRLAYNEKAGNTFFYLIKQLFLIGGCFGVRCPGQILMQLSLDSKRQS